MSHRWTYWMALAVGSFGLLEGRSIAKREQTLSLWLRETLGIQPRKRRRYLLAPLFGAFLTWLFGHILGDWGPHVERPQR